MREAHGALLNLCFMISLQWYDNKDVYAFFTVHSDPLTTVGRQVDKETKDIDCTQIISEYNKYMGGVDLADQTMCYYSVGRKTMKWWRRVFWRMHDQAITNAFVIYKENNPNATNMQQKQFRMELVYALMAPVRAMRQLGCPPGQEISRLSGKHFPYRTDVRRRCVVCAYKKLTPRGRGYKGTKVITWYPKCEAHLCVGKCFELYYTRVNYKDTN